LRLTEYYIFLSVSFLSAISMFVLAIQAFSFRSKGAKMFGLLLLAVAVWNFGMGGSMMSVNESMAFYWTFLQMIGVLLVPPLWLLFTLAYTDASSSLRWWQVALLFANVFISLVLLWFPALRPLFVQAFHFEEVMGYQVIVNWTLGPYFWFHQVLSFIMILFGDVIILRHALQWPHEQGRKLMLIVLATLLPLFTNMALVFNWFPAIHGNIDVFGIVGAGFILAFVLYREDLLALQPIAARRLMEALPDPLLVFDAQFDLKDANPVAHTLFRKTLPADVLTILRELMVSAKDDTQPSILHNLVWRTKAGERHFDVHVQALASGQQLTGYQVLLRDVTELMQVMEQLAEIATTDPLTGLGNRRYFNEQGERLLAQAVRYRHPLSLVTFDIDFLKQVNDRYGHPAGDQMLTEAGRVLTASIRAADVAARLGGDEFGVILPETDLEAVVAFIGRLRKALSLIQLDLPSGQFGGVQASFGIAATTQLPAVADASLDLLMRYADRALYHAKALGRNQVQLWQPTLTDSSDA